MESYIQASEQKHDAAYEAEHDQPQNHGDEPSPDKPESASSGMSESEFLAWLDGLDD